MASFLKAFRTIQNFKKYIIWIFFSFLLNNFSYASRALRTAYGIVCTHHKNELSCFYADDFTSNRPTYKAASALPYTLPPVLDFAISYDYGCAIEADTQKLICWPWLSKRIIGLYLNVYMVNKLPEQTISSAQALGKVLKITSGYSHTCIIEDSDEKKIKCIGDNSYHQIQVPENLGPTIDLVAKDNYTCAITLEREINQQLTCWGNIPSDKNDANDANYFKGVKKQPPKNKRLKVGTLQIPDNIKKVTLGSHHFCRESKETRQITCFGNNKNFQLNVPYIQIKDDSKTSTNVAIGKRHTCISLPKGQTINGKNIACSGNPRVQESLLGINENFFEITSGQNHVCGILASNQRVSCFGDNRLGQTTIPNHLTDVKIGEPNGFGHAIEVAANKQYTCALQTGKNTSNYLISCWGKITLREHYAFKEIRKFFLDGLRHSLLLTAILAPLSLGYGELCLKPVIQTSFTYLDYVLGDEIGKLVKISCLGALELTCSYNLISCLQNINKPSDVNSAEYRARHPDLDFRRINAELDL